MMTKHPPRGAALLPRQKQDGRAHVYAVELRSGIPRIYWRVTA